MNCSSVVAAMVEPFAGEVREEVQAVAVCLAVAAAVEAA